MSIGDRLARLLFIVPYVMHRDGVLVSELAEKLAVRPAQIEADIALLSMVGQPPLTPDHLIDLYIEDDLVCVELDQSLSRPLRLTHDEARALVLAVKLVGNLGGVGQRLEGLVGRILEHLNPVDSEIVRSMGQRIGVWNDEASPEDEVQRLRYAIENYGVVMVDYYSASRDRQKTYRLQPLALLSHTGMEYLVARDVDAALQEKLFRLDRLAAVASTDEHFDPPEQLNLEKFRRHSLYTGSDDHQATVIFAPHLTQHVHERFADRQRQNLHDGSTQVELSTSSPAWLARWVLPFGNDAEVVGPVTQRQHLADLCIEAARAYGRSV
ncbi:MAG: WYL domain-containing protein [Myxococcota bacterium]